MVAEVAPCLADPLPVAVPLVGRAETLQLVLARMWRWVWEQVGTAPVLQEPSAHSQPQVERL